jgi:hypothetical protein
MDPRENIIARYQREWKERERWLRDRKKQERRAAGEPPAIAEKRAHRAGNESKK